MGASEGRRPQFAGADYRSHEIPRVFDALLLRRFKLLDVVLKYGRITPMRIIVSSRCSANSRNGDRVAGASLGSSLIVMLCIMLSTSASAANFYVRQGASGDGSNWANAFGSLPPTLQRGSTYYVADGVYSGATFDTPSSGTMVVTIKKATGVDHGTDTGWQGSYGDGQAEFRATGTVLTFETPYWVFDGQVGAGQSGYGFKVTVTGMGDAARGIRLLQGYITISHTEITSANPAGVSTDSKQDGIYTTAAAANSVTISHNYIHEWKRCAILVSGTTGWTIENNFIYHTYSTSGAHGQAIQFGPGAVSNMTIRHNTFKDTHGTGVIVYLDNSFDDIRIYGNLFWHTGEPAAIGINSTSQAIGSTNGDTATNIKIHNNTFIGMKGRSPTPSGAIDNNGTAVGNEAYNNVWYDCVVTFDGTAHDYNWFYMSGSQSEVHGQNGTGDPFINRMNGDFRLISTTLGGMSLPTPFNVDRLGAIRGGDGTWDRGAYEFGSSSLAPPGGLTATVK